MTIVNGICPNCKTVNAVESNTKSSTCTKCKKSFFTEQAIATWDAAFAVTLRRANDPAIKNDITFNLVHYGDLRVLANDGELILLVAEQTFEIPVMITYRKTTFEGVLTGTGDGKDIEITWAASASEPQLGHIVSTTNPTVRLVERPGAATSQKLNQESI